MKFNRHEIKESFRDFIDDKDWNYFSTLTFKYNTTKKSVRRIANKLFSYLYNLGQKLKLGMFWVAERFQGFGNYHIHTLLHTQIASRKIKRWCNYYGRNEIERYDPKLNASDYLTKHVTNDMIDYDIRFNDRYLMNQSI